MDGPRECHTERSQSKREKQILYNITYINGKDNLTWEAETDTILENKCMDSKREGSGKNWETVMDSYTTNTMYKIDN